MTEHPHTVDERGYLPPMGRRWLLPLYDPLTRLAGVSRLHDGPAAPATIQPRHPGPGVWRTAGGPGMLWGPAAPRPPDAEVIGTAPAPAALRRARRKAKRAGL